MCMKNLANEILYASRSYVLKAISHVGINFHIKKENQYEIKFNSKAFKFLLKCNFVIFQKVLLNLKTIFHKELLNIRSFLFLKDL